MKTRFFVLGTILMVFLGVVSLTGYSAQMRDMAALSHGNLTGGVRADVNLGKMPLYFIFNQGQVDKKVAFYAKTSRYTLWLTPEGMVFDRAANAQGKRDVSRLLFLHANPHAAIQGGEPSPHRVNYWVGADRTRWFSHIPTTRGVWYKNLYKHIDLNIYGLEKQIEYDWIVKPGGLPGDISFTYTQVQETSLDKEGNLWVQSQMGEWKHQKPVCFQYRQGKKEWVQASFKKLGPHTYGFEVGAYDGTLDLVIDPVVLAYSSYLGGSGSDIVAAIAVDNSGLVYTTGVTSSSDFPVLNAYQNYQGGSDVFISQFNPQASGAASLVYSTYLGGSGNEGGKGIAVDQNGVVYITGQTNSANFPTLNPYQTLQGGTDAFFCVLDTRLSGAAGLLYATYLGGSADEMGTSLALDGACHVYVTGYTNSVNFPTLSPFQTHQGGSDVFVSKFDPSLSGSAALLYSTYLGGQSTEYGSGITVDPNGYAYVTGYTYDATFPLRNAYQSYQGGVDVFVAKLDTGLIGTASLLYATCLGGTNNESGYAIAVDEHETVYITGDTYGTDFPLLHAFQGVQAKRNGFVTKLDTRQSGAACLLYSSYLGGSVNDCGVGIRLDGSGYVYVMGDTTSPDFPLQNQYADFQGFIDSFVVKMDLTREGRASLLYSTCLGGVGIERGAGLAVDGAGNAYVAGETLSADFPLVNPYQTDPETTNSDSYLAKFAAFEPQVIPLVDTPTSTGIGSTTATLGGRIQSIGDAEISEWGIYWSPQAGFDPAVAGTKVAGMGEQGVGVFSVAVTGLPANTTLYFRAFASNAAGTGYSNEASFTTVDHVGITVTAPVGGESWPFGVIKNITWQVEGVTGNVKITLWRNGLLVGLIADDIDAAAGSYGWKVGKYDNNTASAPLGAGYTIKIKEKGTGVSGCSPAPFTIAPSIRVITPNGGEQLQRKSEYAITWRSKGTAENFRITLWKEGTLIGIIEDNYTFTTPSYTWIVGKYIGGIAPVGSGYWIKIKEVGTNVSDKSDQTFAIIH